MEIVDKGRFDRAIILLYYYLGVRDGISAALESFKGLNREPLKDANWRLELRNHLPRELAALRQPHADMEPASNLIIHELTEALRIAKRHRSEDGRAVKSSLTL